MKTIKLVLIGISITLSTTVQSCSASTDKINISDTETHECTGVCEHSHEKEFTKVVSEIRESKIILKKGKVIEIAFASIKGGKESQIEEQYFPKIMPIAAKYGGKILGSFEVVAIVGGEIHPQTIVMFEWPSVDAQKQLQADPEAKKLFPIRDEAITFINLGYYSVEKEVTLTFKEDKTYEFFNAWLTPESKTALPEYFKQSAAPKKNYGPPKFIADLKPRADSPKESHVLIPNMCGIVEWNSTSEYYGLISDPEFKKVEHLLTKSISRMDMIHAKFNFQ